MRAKILRGSSKGTDRKDPRKTRHGLGLREKSITENDRNASEGEYLFLPLREVEFAEHGRYHFLGSFVLVY